MTATILVVDDEPDLEALVLQNSASRFATVRLQFMFRP